MSDGYDFDWHKWLQKLITCTQILKEIINEKNKSYLKNDLQNSGNCFYLVCLVKMKEEWN